MKFISLRTLFTAVFLTCIGTTYAQIQTQPLDNFAIHPFGTVFNPTQKFIALGESGGVPGPIPSTGCDLYGFRAQLDPDFAISVGVQRVLPLFTFPAFPTISTSEQGLLVVQQNSLPPTFELDTRCGNLLAFFGQSASSTNVFTIFGSGTALGGMFGPSDRKLKRNIQVIENPMDIINGLTGYTYEYRIEERPGLGLPKGTRYGFITQEVQKVMPTVVRQATKIDGQPEDFQVMEYDAIVPVLTEAL